MQRGFLDREFQKRVSLAQNLMAKNIALTKIESHEKLCRIMQKQTHEKIKSIERQIDRIEMILLTSVGALITGMAGMIYMLITK